MEKTKLILYTPIQGADQDALRQQFFSLLEHKDSFPELAQFGEDYRKRIVHVVDPHAGTEPPENRPAFIQMLAEAVSYRTAAVMVESMSCISADPEAVDYFAGHYFPSNHIRLICMKEGYDSRAKRHHCPKQNRYFDESILNYSG